MLWEDHDSIEHQKKEEKAETLAGKLKGEIVIFSSSFPHSFFREKR